MGPGSPPARRRCGSVPFGSLGHLRCVLARRPRARPRRAAPSYDAVVTPVETVILGGGSDTNAVLAPERGGILTRWSVAGRSLLYLDEATLASPSRNIRGGNPVLFPSPGPLADGRFAYGGREGRMPQHGLARRYPFTVVETGSHHAVLRLRTDEHTRAEFPWGFELTLRYALDGATLAIEQTIVNQDDAPLPFAFGFHPYFAVPSADKARVAIPTGATRAWDNVVKRTIERSGPIDLAAGEVDLHLYDHGQTEAALVLADGARIVVRASEAFGRWVIWTLPDKDFVCLEPWTAAADALNTGEDLLVVEPGASRNLEVSFALE